ncbi:MAG: hypothetical protein KC431_29405 [Myxococcales bacterium]|nr:hypothetical protein [Myxococcales bacterium]
MKETKTMRMLIETTVFALALSLVACGGDQGGKADKGDKTAAKGDAGDKAGADKGEVAAADDGAGADEAPALDPKVEKAVTIANKISADPGSTDAILGEAGMDRDSFEALIYEIARDPELSKSYAIARET